MLFCYPLAATADNWVHEAFVGTIEIILDALDMGAAPPTWPDCVPQNYRAQLAGRSALQAKVEAFSSVAATLAKKHRALVRQALHVQNDFPANLSSAGTCIPIVNLPNKIRKPLKELADYFFGLLKDFAVRDEHFKIIHGAIRARVCPFCGCEFFDAPGAPRHDLDHYIPLSKYPFAGANLRNLSPMGDRCNSSYKLSQDILVDDTGQRRACYDPYGAKTASIRLAGSNLFDGDTLRPQWSVDVGSDPEAATWDAVWRVRERYIRDHLDVEFQTWLGDFGNWCKALSARGVSFASSDALDGYIDYLRSLEFRDRAFIKCCFFELVRDALKDPGTGDRTERLLQDVMMMAV